MDNKLFLIVLGFILVFSACKQDESVDSDIKFELVPAGHSGIEFINELKDNPLTDRNVLSYEYYYHGAGVALLDINNDQLVDIFFSSNEQPNRLYLNQGNLQFKDITENANINQNKNWASGVTVVDINGDGYMDIYVCQQGPFTEPDERRNLLYINNGDLTFTEHAKDYGLDDGNLSTQSVFFDFDKDGDLDCYVMNESKYVRIDHKIIFEDIKIRENLEAASGHLYRNNGNGTFDKITEQAGMLKLGFGLGVVVSDFNADNWPDLYVANDYFIPDFLYINQQDGTFKESIKDYTKQVSFFGMGCDAGDINNDGLVDMYVVDMAAQDHVRSKTLMESMNVPTFWYYINTLGLHFQYMFNSLQLNNGDGTFSNIANFSNVASTDWSWSTLLSDFNLDGYKDIFVTNGYRRYARDNDFRNEMKKARDMNGGEVPLALRQELYEKMPEVQLPNKFFLNKGNLKFEDAATEFGLSESTYSYGAALGDLDNDGDFDLVVNNTDQLAMLWKNNASDIHNYIKIKLEYPKLPSVRYNSKVYIYSDASIQFQEYNFVRGYESTMEECLLFGLGDQKSIDSIKIIWSDDNIQVVNNPKINSTHKIKYQASGRTFIKSVQSGKQALFAEKAGASKNVNFQHIEDPYDDFIRESLLPHRQSTLGPSLASADINNDGLTDFYIGGAKGYPGALYVQMADGSFTIMEGQPWTADFESEDVGALFIDVNNDGFKDLFVLSGGGGAYMDSKELLLDRFYANVKGERFVKIGNAIPEYTAVSSCIEAFDFDSDGDIDLFIGGGSSPGNYPTNERSVFLRNDNNIYTDISEEVFPESYDFGIVKSCRTTDVDQDGKLDMILAGEWTNIHVLLNRDEKFVDASNDYGVDSMFGWWHSILPIDYDGDGDEDYIVGNMSENYKHHVSKEKPLFVFFNDFDDNGIGDIVLSKQYHGELVPARGKECSTGQMPFLAEKVKTYNEFASSNVYEIYGDDKIKSSKTLLVNTFESIVLINEGGTFSIQELPVEAQLFPILDMLKSDLNSDGLEDIIMIGNIYNTEVETPRVDAGNGLVLINKGKGNYKPLTISESGFKVPGNSKKLSLLRTKRGITIVVANNNDKPQFFEIN